MIKNKDRSGWIGASDTAVVMGSWSGKTFERFWLVKMGLVRDDFESVYMKTGNHFEGKILDHLGIRKRDRQIRIRRLRLRVNLDGENRAIHEVKTHKAEVYKLPRAHWMQAQVEMFAAGKPLVIVSYRMEPEDYGNWLRPIDPARLRETPVEYDREWVETEYLPRLRILADCLKRRAWPIERNP